MMKPSLRTTALVFLLGGTVGCTASEWLTDPTVAAPAFRLSGDSSVAVTDASFYTIETDDFYLDPSRGQLIPPSNGSAARIEQPVSLVALDCVVGKCNAAFQTQHTGRWHWTKQTMNWSLQESDGRELGGGSPSTTLGVGCAKWLGGFLYCIDQKQANGHQVIANTNSCYVSARLSTDHEASWSLVYHISFGYLTIQPLEWGYTSVSDIPQAAVSDTHCDEDSRFTCDNPFTATVETCTLTTTGQAYTVGSYDGQVSTQSSTGVMMVCEVWDWYKSYDGGKTKEYTHTTYENCKEMAQ